MKTKPTNDNGQLVVASLFAVPDDPIADLSLKSHLIIVDSADSYWSGLTDREKLGLLEDYRSGLSPEQRSSVVQAWHDQCS